MGAGALLAVLAEVTRQVQGDIDQVAVEAVVQAHQHVLQRRHLAEQLHVLEGAGDAGQRDVGRGAAVDRAAGKHHRAGGRLVDAGQHIHHRALARAIGADQAVDAAALDDEVDVVQRLQAAELHQHATGLEQLAVLPVVALGASAGERGGGRGRRVPLDLGLEVQRIAHEADNAVLQVVDDEQRDQAEDRQPPVGHGLELERHQRQTDRADHRDGRRLAAHLAALEGHADRDRHDQRQHHRADAEDLQIVQQLGQHHDDGRAEQRAGARLAAAHDDGQQEHHGQLEVVGVRADVLLGVGIERTRQARECRRDHEGIDLVAVDRHAHAVRRHRAAAQGLEGAAELRVQHPVHKDQRRDQTGHHQPVVLHLVERMAEELGLGQRDAHRALGQEGHLVDQDLDDGAEGQRHHGQIRPGHPQGRQRQHRAKHRRHRDGGRQRGIDRGVELQDQHTGRVGADAEQARVPERHLAGVAHDDVQAEQHDRIDHDGLDQVDVVRVAGHQREGGQGRDGGQAESSVLQVHVSSLPSDLLDGRLAEQARRLHGQHDEQQHQARHILVAGGQVKARGRLGHAEDDAADDDAHAAGQAADDGDREGLQAQHRAHGGAGQRQRRDQHAGKRGGQR
mmetsp:Transcript_5286/g.19868  ORF Transcript_5286/g.19868 Transcript_5286/m.19868 type:complete len:622 (-) Transcript_5286:4456-6321(-)